MSSLHQLNARHIQNFSEAASLEPHWGYVSRALPCTNDAGSCAYLDSVYASHDKGMLYSGILWGTILAVIIVLAFYSRSSNRSLPTAAIHDRSAVQRLSRAVRSSLRRRLLPETWRPVFGRSTRLQVAVLAILVGYLTIWTFVGITYQTWITPVKGKAGVYNTRTALGPWSDRIGVLAYALTPFSVLLGTRESLLSVLTGIPYQKFNFLHRWLGWIIFVQSGLHTIGWCIVEFRLYQPQPDVGKAFIVQQYIIWGVVAMALLAILVALSTPWAIRLTGYEFFRKAHYILAMVYIGACWGHWEQLKCFLLPALLLWFVDRGARLVRTTLLHYQLLDNGDFGFEPAHATVTRFEDPQGGDVLRLDFELDQDPWQAGQHFYLCFTESSIWQSHPFTPLSRPQIVNGKVKHSYVLRAKQGETKKLAALAAQKASTFTNTPLTTNVVLAGPYGENVLDNSSPNTNIVCVAGGTGITYVLPFLLELASQHRYSEDRQLELIWAVRHSDDLQWIAEELATLRHRSTAINLKIRLYATRDCRCGAVCQCGRPELDEKGMNVAIETVSDTSESIDMGTVGGNACDEAVQAAAAAAMSLGRPDVRKLISQFVDDTVRGRTTVIASGPGGMISDTRIAVTACNSGRQVWKGQQKFDVDLICDDRLEW